MEEKTGYVNSTSTTLYCHNQNHGIHTSYVGDVQFMALASWLRHEEMRAGELKRQLEEELTTP